MSTAVPNVRIALARAASRLPPGSPLLEDPSFLHALGTLASDAHADVRMGLAPLRASSHARLAPLFEAAVSQQSVRRLLPPPPGLGAPTKGEEKEGENRGAVVGIAAVPVEEAGLLERVCGDEGDASLLSSSPASSSSSASSLIDREPAEGGDEGVF